MTYHKNQNERRIKTALLQLGCEQVGANIFAHEDIAEHNLDFSATSADHILLRLYQIFTKIGYKQCKQDFRAFIDGGSTDAR